MTVDNEAAACLGLGLGASRAFAGAFGFAGAGLALGGVVAEDSLLAVIFPLNRSGLR
jgi:hypothetical protein